MIGFVNRLLGYKTMLRTFQMPLVPWFLLSPPDKIDNEYLEEFNSSLSRIMSNRNAHVLVGGDFNCGDIEWSHMQVPHGVQKRLFGYYL